MNRISPQVLLIWDLPLVHGHEGGTDIGLFGEWATTLNLYTFVAVEEGRRGYA